VRVQSASAKVGDAATGAQATGSTAKAGDGAQAGPESDLTIQPPAETTPQPPDSAAPESAAQKGASDPSGATGGETAASRATAHETATTRATAPETDTSQTGTSRAAAPETGTSRTTAPETGTSRTTAPETGAESLPGAESPPAAETLPLDDPIWPPWEPWPDPEAWPAADLHPASEAPQESESLPGSGAYPVLETAEAMPADARPASPPGSPPATTPSAPAPGTRTATIADARPTTPGTRPAIPGTSVPAAPGTAADTKTGWRAPGLDGLRALAVLAVLAFHENLPWFPGGFLGVDIFFVLSGYLITDLLVARFARDGRVGLGGFWIRRARRLLPALAVMLTTVTAAVAVLEPDQIGGLRPALLGAITYTSNWWQALAHQSYFAQFGPPPPLQHLWSLAVEEQFYLIWPLILALVLMALHRPVQRAVIAWTGAAASALAMLAIYVPGADPSLAYYGTDTHASALMIGAALALTWPLAKVAAAARPLRRRLDAVGLAGLVILGWAVWHFSGGNPAVYPFGLVLAALAAGGVVLAAAAPGLVGTMLAWGPLRWLGIRSYGIYLWHWPVIAMTAGLAGQAASSVPARVADAVLPIGLAAASWHWLERPILRNGLRADVRRRGQQMRQAVPITRRTPAAALPILGTVAMLAVACTAGYGILHHQAGSALEQQIAAGAKVSVASQAGQPLAPSQANGLDPWRIRAVGGGPYHAGRGVRLPRVPGAKVLAIGDSVMLASAPELEHALPGIYIDAKVSRAMIAGVALVRQLAADKRLRPVVIVGLGTNGPVSPDQIRQLRTTIGARWLILINVFEQRPWEHEVNTTLAAAASRYPNVLLVNWHAAIEHRTGLLWSDGIHPQPSGGKLYASVVRAVVLAALRSRRPRQSSPRPKPRQRPLVYQPPHYRHMGL